jgi:flagellar capping protein FliD
MNRSYSNSGNYKRLEEIGISFDSNMKLNLDNEKFSTALKENRSDVTALLDIAMGGINDVLSQYTKTSGYLSKSITSLEGQKKTYDLRISKYNDTLMLRKQALYKQYLEYQTQLADLGRTAEMFGINLGSNVNTSG